MILLGQRNWDKSEFLRVTAEDIFKKSRLGNVCARNWFLVSEPIGYR